MQFLDDFNKIKKNFGIIIAYRLIVIPRIAFHLGIKKDLYTSALLKWLKKILKDLIFKYKIEEEKKKISLKLKIWTCWWQGEEDMPDVIKLCYNSLKKNSNGYEVILINKNNFKDYITLPSFILNKVEQGKINLSHLSDIIRCALLLKYGGWWVDAALYVTQPLIMKKRLYTIKKGGVTNSCLNMNKWQVGAMFCTPNHILFKFLYDSLCFYWEKFDVAVQYLFIDAFIRIAYEEFKTVKEDIDNIKVNSPEWLYSRYNFSKKAEDKRFQKLIKNNQFISLTWRWDFKIKTLDGSPTYYSLLQRENEK